MVTLSNQSSFSERVNVLAASTTPLKVCAVSTMSELRVSCSLNALYVEIISKNCFLTSVDSGLSVFSLIRISPPSAITGCRV